MGDMKFYRNLLETGELEYARVHERSARADYFDDEFRIWVASDGILDEIENDGTWTQISEHEVEHAAEAWPGSNGFDLSRMLV